MVLRNRLSSHSMRAPTIKLINVRAIGSLVDPLLVDARDYSTYYVLVWWVTKILPNGCSPINE